MAHFVGGQYSPCVRAEPGIQQVQWSRSLTTRGSTNLDVYSCTHVQPSISLGASQLVDVGIQERDNCFRISAATVGRVVTVSNGRQMSGFSITPCSIHRCLLFYSFYCTIGCSIRLEGSCSDRWMSGLGRMFRGSGLRGPFCIHRWTC